MRLLEIYDSVQGEGPNVGLPTTFVRFAGCNMRCPGWPCDTPYAIFPDQFKNEAVQVPPAHILNDVLKRSPKHICITGGEPLIQNKDEMLNFMDLLLHARYTWDLFTNGSRSLKDYLLYNYKMTVVMDWKLTGSGEGSNFLPQREENLYFLSDKDAIKFVVKNRDDMLEAADLVARWDKHGFGFQMYMAPAWGIVEPAEIVEFLDSYNLFNVKLNLQVHKYIWPAEQRGI